MDDFILSVSRGLRSRNFCSDAIWNSLTACRHRNEMEWQSGNYVIILHYTKRDAVPWCHVISALSLFGKNNILVAGIWNDKSGRNNVMYHKTHKRKPEFLAFSSLCRSCEMNNPAKPILIISFSLKNRWEIAVAMLLCRPPTSTLSDLFATRNRIILN